MPLLLAVACAGEITAGVDDSDADARSTIMDLDACAAGELDTTAEGAAVDGLEVLETFSGGVDVPILRQVPHKAASACGLL
jgi:hypothetical protein